MNWDKSSYQAISASDSLRLWRFIDLLTYLLNSVTHTTTFLTRGMFPSCQEPEELVSKVSKVNVDLYSASSRTRLYYATASSTSALISAR